MIALTLSMPIQVGKEHIIPHIMIVEIGDVEHSLGTHLVAMNHNGGSVGRLGGHRDKGHEPYSPKASAGRCLSRNDADTQSPSRLKSRDTHSLFSPSNARLSFALPSDS